ncbi:MAG: ATP-binding cassette domain-containing protein, partial [Chloroflexi bacterium]|nr:ATP-binding cassette domain-containing protein [Chloroflexota bacterium]
DPDAYVDTLTVGERQQLELVRLLWLGARVLILDEPTTGISAPQKVKLFAALRKLAAEGRTIIFVTHKLDEVFQLCHRAAVLRAGTLVAEIEPPYRTEAFIKAMFGYEVDIPPRQPLAPGPTLLSLKGVTVEDARLEVGPIDLDVQAGEVIGLAGMEGSGQDLLLRLCAGLLRATGGEIRVNGRPLHKAGYREFLKNKIRFMPADRLREGLVNGLTLTEHFALNAEAHGFLIDYHQAEKTATARIEEYSIRGFPTSVVESLSGGNQQRTLLALLNTSLDLLLLEHPTRGLDLESAVFIWGRLKARARAPMVRPSCSSPRISTKCCNTATGCWSSSPARSRDRSRRRRPTSKSSAC